MSRKRFCLFFIYFFKIGEFGRIGSRDCVECGERNKDSLSSLWHCFEKVWHQGKEGGGV